MRTIRPLLFVLCCVGILGPQLLLAANEPSNIEREILQRQAVAEAQQIKIAKQSEKPKSPGQKAVDVINSAIANAIYGSGESTRELKNLAVRVVQENISSPAVRKALYKVGGYSIRMGPITLWLDKVPGYGDFAATLMSFTGAVVGKDPEGAATSLINGTASGMSAAGGAKLGAIVGAPLGPVGSLVGGVVGGFSGALAYNELAAPQVEKGGDYVSDKVQNGNEKIRQKKIRIQQQYDKDLATVYPDPKDRPDPNNEFERDALTGMNYNLRPDVLSQRAEAIRKREEQEMVVVPEVAGKTIADAMLAIKSAGLKSKVVGGDPPPDRNLSERVQEQKPKGASSILFGQTVELTVYSPILIPDVEGWKKSAAIKLLETQGFYVETVPGDPPTKEDQKDSVQSQIPSPNTSGKDHSKVTLVVYSGVEVPAVVEMSIIDAKVALVEKWFVVDQQWGDPASVQQEVGRVVFQEPAAGEPADEGSQVKVWVNYTETPEVLGAKLGDAVAAMESAWFAITWKKDQETDDESKWGRVYSQSIQAKERYAETGIAIELKVYDSPELPDEKVSHPVLGFWEGTYQPIGQEKGSVNTLVVKNMTPDGECDFEAKNTVIWPTTGKLVTQELRFHVKLEGKTFRIMSRAMRQKDGSWKDVDELPITKKYPSREEFVWDEHGKEINGKSFMYSDGPIGKRIKKGWNLVGVYHWEKTE